MLAVLLLGCGRAHVQDVEQLDAGAMDVREGRGDVEEGSGRATVGRPTAPPFRSDAGAPAVADDDAGAAPDDLECSGYSSTGAALAYTVEHAADGAVTASCTVRWRDGEGVIRSWVARAVGAERGECRVLEGADSFARAHWAMEPWRFELIDGSAIATNENSGERAALTCELL